ncbi:MFS transporter [Gallaecimonas mangrovi]|uniref:MFS transporter n=1 Tax=Gallaecimonas mangrovi TaxID=2291597 RepID=UPI000E1FE506|nr:MFS transporter [Gallaecimonas mangrovi]
MGAFGIGTTEFSPMGLLPQIAQGVGVSIPTAGLLISAYAAGVMLGAPFMTLYMSRFGKRPALILLMAIFTIGNLTSALAPNYISLLASRILTSLNHGAFFGLGAVVASSLVPANKRASAVATMFMGLTIANIGGVPAATWIGQHLGWRLAFIISAGLGVITMIALRFALPMGRPGQKPDIKAELKVLTQPAVLTALATTVMGAGAMFTLYTYVSALLQTVSGASDNFVSLILVLIGVGFTLGNIISGRLADWSLTGAASIFFCALAMLMVLLPLTLGHDWLVMVMFVLWGAAAFGIAPPVQIQVMHVAAKAPGLASSVNIGAFNLGNALGAALGGAVLKMHLGYPMVPVAGALLALGGLGLVALSHRHAKAAQLAAE